MKIDLSAGIKTSEFWLTLCSIVLVAGADQLGLKLDLAATIGVVTTVVGYIASRTFLKKKAEEEAK